jgi:signal transduction histidine kinase
MSLSERALLVEDDESLRMLLAQMLVNEGLIVDAFENAEDAWIHYQQHHAMDYRLILLDWVLPGKTGLEMCQQIRQREDSAAAYIWVITSRNGPQDLLQVLEAGANEYLSKPLDIDLLTVRIRVALRQSEWVQQHYLAEQSLNQYQQGLEAQVEERTQQMRALAARLIEVQESQQKRISREIHDELGQVMTALKLDLSWLKQRVEAPELTQKIERMLPMVSDTIHTIQRICAELRPGILDDLGLIAAIEWFTQEFEERTQIRCHVRLPEDITLSAELSVTLFRITQESLTNIMRHAHASEVNLRLEDTEQGLDLYIQDNGCGMDVDSIRDNPRSIGILGIQERLIPWQGQLNIHSEPDKGTQMHVSILNINALKETP